MVNHQDSVEGKFVVAVVTRDHSEVWRVDVGTKEPLAKVVREAHGGEHRHVRQAQANHGHFALEGVTEYFDSLSSALSPASEIFLVGHGSGKADIVAAFVDHAKKYSPAVHTKISEVHHEDVSRLTSGQIVALARGWKDKQTLR
jgi:hypothetical protein